MRVSDSKTMRKSLKQAITLKRSYTFTFAAFLMLWMFCFSEQQPAIPHELNHYFKQVLNQNTTELERLKTYCSEKKSKSALQNQFKKCRLLYKKLSVFTDYYTPLFAQKMNSPAIERIESGVADQLLPPEGFQLIETLLFNNGSHVPHEEIQQAVSKMISHFPHTDPVSEQLYSYESALIWEALRTKLVDIATLGITGFDSPIALHSLPEASASMTGISDVLLIIQSCLHPNQQRLCRQLVLDLKQASTHLNRSPSFNAFDRLHFLSEILNPIYRKLIVLRQEAQIKTPEGRSAVNHEAPSIFDPTFFQINFYGPPKEYWATPQRIELGQKIFEDPILSGDSSRSCKSCHLPEKAFTDGIAKPYSLDQELLINRNTPTLLYAGLQTKQFMDSRSDILENQLTEVIHNANEMNGNLKDIVQRMRRNPEYIRQFQQAYPDEPTPLNAFTLANSLANYIRSLKPFNSRFDLYMQGARNTLNTAEKNGFNLFAGKAKCATCHFLPLLNGVVPPFFQETESEVLGVPQYKDAIWVDPDEGKYHTTKSNLHKYAFKTPTLRNIALTAPYMHNGIYTNLEDVIEFYNKGGAAGLGIKLPNQTLSPEPLLLTTEEQKNLILFLRALTDQDLNNPAIPF